MVCQRMLAEQLDTKEELDRLAARHDGAMRLEFSGPPAHKRLAFSIDAPKTRAGYLQTHRTPRRCIRRRVHHRGAVLTARC
jgi:hypothetical protein